MQTSNFMKISPVGAKSFHAGGETDKKKQRVAFLNFVKAPKMHDKFSNTVYALLQTVQIQQINHQLLLCVVEVNFSGIFRRGNTNLCKHFTAAYCCHLVVVIYVTEKVIQLQCKQIRN
jgi:hypothetical protein